ncbi:MAG: hypothetical protein U5R31_10055 [Acidimicrobiia bacterium]|nr:hypothetical protein [Acidimicrobiia bacterium]
MTRLDVDSLAPGDGALALRSFPRRYRETFEGTRRRSRAGRVGPDGVSPLELLADTVRSLSALERALEQVLTENRPVLNAAVLDPSTRAFDSGVGDLDDEARRPRAHRSRAFADRVDRVGGDDWAREATVTGGGTATALDVLREAVRTGADNLRTADRLLERPGPDD